MKNIFLDLDGPLLDGKDRHYFCYRTILEKYGRKPVDIETYWEMKRSLVNRKDLLKLSGASDVYDQFLEDWLLMIELPEVLALDHVQQGAIDCLSRWRECGIELTLVTMRKERSALLLQLKQKGLFELLNSVLDCHHADGGLGKADAVRRHYAGKLSLKDSVWVGDTEADWEAAKSLGCEVVLLSNGLRSEAYLNSLPGAVVKPCISSIGDLVLRKFDPGCSVNSGSDLKGPV